MKASRILKTVVMPWTAGRVIRQEADELARYAAVAVPGEATVTLPAGRVRVSYRESVKRGGGSIDVDFAPPASLELSIRPARGGAPLEIRDGRVDFLTTGASRSGPPLSVIGIGAIDASAPGDFIVSARADSTGLVEPHVLLGRV